MNKKMAVVGRLSLLGATLIWGSAFVVMKNTLDAITPFYLLAIRFTAAALILAIIFFKQLRGMDRRAVGMGAIMGTLLYAAYLTQTVGLTTTTPGVNAFLTSVYCVIVPFLYWIIAKKRPDNYHIGASVICIIGIGLVSLNGSFKMGMGDMLTLMCGFFFALHIIAVAGFSQRRDIFALTVTQFAAAAVLGWISGFIFEGPLPVIPSRALLPLAYLSVMATAAALLLQSIGQKYTNVSAVAIIMSLESVFGVLFSVIFYHEKVGLRIGIGFALIFAAIIISETKLSFLRGRKAADHSGS